MGQKILTDYQERALFWLANRDGFSEFYLSGGTALAAYYFEHRYSDDLDFFAFEKPNTLELHAIAQELKSALGATEVRYERLRDRNMFFFLCADGELKIEFTQYPFRQMEVAQEKNGIRVDSLRDIAANKLATLLDRFDPKDFVDLYYIFRERGLAEVRRDVETKFGIKADPVFIGGEFMKVRRIEALPRMILPLTKEELKSFFLEQVKMLAPEVFR